MDEPPASEPPAGALEEGAPAPRASRRRRAWLWLALPLLITAIALGRWWLTDEGHHAPARAHGPTPVELAAIERGPFEDLRTFTGALEPSAEVVVVAEVEGTVVRVHADLADEVAPGQVLVTLDDREYRQREVAARAELAVGRARAEAARGASELAARGLERAEALNERGITSVRGLDSARAAALEASSQLAIAQAEVERARAAWNSARLALERTEVVGRWSEEGGPRLVARRHVDEGARVSVGDPLISLVDDDPLVVAVMAGVDDHRRLRVGQPVRLLREDEELAVGAVARVSPAFDPGSRQARIEIEVPNPDGALHPGSFVRAVTVLDHFDDATVVPEASLVTRGGDTVVFVVADGERTARMVPVEVRLRGEGRVAVEADGLAGRVVVLGQQRLTDGAEIRAIDDEAPR